MSRAGIIVFIIALLGCGCVSASVVPDIDTVRVMSETEVTARAVDRTVSSSRQVQTMTRSQIEALGIENVGQALSRMAGTQVRDYGGVGGMKTVSVHSLGAAHTGVTYDGLMVSDCQAGQIDVGRFFIDNIGEISLSMGHDEDLLISASQLSSAAMLRLSSAAPAFSSDSSRHALKAIVKTGSWGEFSPTVMYAHRLWTSDILGVNACYQRADGHYPFTLSNGNTPLNYKRANTDIESGNVEVNWSGDVWRGGWLEAKAYAYLSERGLPGTAIYYNNVSRQRLFDANTFAQLRLTQRLVGQWLLQVRAKYNLSYNRYEDKDRKYPTGSKIDRYQQNEGYLSATALWRWHDLGVAVAQDVRLNKLEMRMGMTQYEPDPTRFTSLTSLQARYTRPHVSVNGSLLLTVAHETVRKGTPMPSPARLSPSLSLTCRPWLSHRLFVRAMYKDTYRMPSFNDLYYDRIGNTELRPEKAHEWSVGMAWERDMGSVWLSLSADGYLHRVEDKIVAMPGVYVWKMLNFGHVHISGIDATLRCRWTLPKGFAFGADAAYTCQRVIDRSDSRLVGYGNQLPYTPRHSGNVSATFDTPWVSCSWNMQAMGERYAMVDTTPENLMPCFIVHDVNVWHETRHLRLQLTLANIGDRQYDIVRYYPMPGRHIRGTIIFKL